MKMEVLTKKGDELLIVYHPSEKIEVGSSLIVKDNETGRGLLIQVIEDNLVDLPGILEDIVRKVAVTRLEITEHTPAEFKGPYMDIQNMKVARAKIRKEIKEDELTPWSGWCPSRNVAIEPLPDKKLYDKLGIGEEKYEIAIGETFTGEEFRIDVRKLQGINVIVGKKGTGKSHLAKTILLGLIDHGAKCIVFDINDEYSGLRYTIDNGESSYHDRIIVLEPNPHEESPYEPLKFTLDYIGIEVMYAVLTQTLNLPEASAYVFRENWESIKATLAIEKGDESSLDRVAQVISERASKREAEAIRKRLHQILKTGIITFDEEEETRIEKLLEELEGGGAIIVNLKAKGIVAQQIVVQTILSKLQELLEKPEMALFLFAEEAHLYLEKTVWLDLVTRMRHLGAFQFYMTNTPTSIDETIIRQTDNIFTFNLTNRSDLNHIMPATKIDEETITSITKTLPPRTFIAVGEATSDYPFILRTKKLDVQTAGETKLLWRM